MVSEHSTGGRKKWLLHKGLLHEVRLMHNLMALRVRRKLLYGRKLQLHRFRPRLRGLFDPGFFGHGRTAMAAGAARIAFRIYMCPRRPILSSSVWAQFPPRPRFISSHSSLSSLPSVFACVLGVSGLLVSCYCPAWSFVAVSHGLGPSRTRFILGLVEFLVSLGRTTRVRRHLPFKTSDYSGVFRRTGRAFLVLSFLNA